MRWIQRTDVSSPGERCHHAMAYDSDRKVVVFFGGEIGETGSEEYFNDTQEYDGVQWKQMSILSDTKPSHRSFHTMAYNPISKRVMLHGGFTGGKFAHDDTWSYRFDGVQGVWEQNEAGGEEGVAGARMVYDTVHQGILRHGGISAPFYESGVFDPFLPPPEAAAKWWTGQTWNPLATEGPGVWGACAAWDSYRGRLVIVGGFKKRLEQGLSAEHWEFDGITWTNLGSPIPGRGHGATAYDSKRQRVLIVGGISGVGGTGSQVYSYDGKQWIRLPDFPGVGRAGSAMIYDSHRDRMVLVAGVGGLADGKRHSDTWEAEFVPLSPPQIDPSTSVTNCEGQSRTIFLKQFADREVTFQWAKVGFQNSLTPVPGATFQNLDFPSLTYTNRGKYVLIWTDKCGNSAQSDPVEIVVHTKPITFLDDTPIFRCPGDQVSMQVNVSSERPVTYQWYRNGAGIQGATNQTYTVENLTHAHTGDYDVLVVNSCGQTYSDYVHLQVGVSIKGHPASTTADVCGTASFSATAVGVGTLRYQWRLDGAPLPEAYPFQGVTTTKLTIQNVLYSHEGLYDVLVTDDCGPVHAVSSNPAKLTVLPGPQWVLRATNGPAPRTGARMAFDSSRNVSLMFGGATNNGNFGVFTQNDIWEWNGSLWLQRVTNSPLGGWYQAPPPDGRWYPSDTNQPVGRFNHGFAYDSYRNRFVLFGGAAISPTGFQYFLNDVWEWDGIKWYFMGTNGPRPRVTFGFAYDSARRVTVMTGGFIDGPNDPNIIWEWNGTDWNKTTVTNSPATNYSQDGLMVYDSFRGQTIFGPVVGNTYLWDFWLWDGINYTNVQQGHTFLLSKLGGIAFDSYRRRTVYFGGHGSPPYNATAFFDGKSWEFLTNSLATPKGRHGPAATFDSARKAVVMFGGQSDNWIYEGDTWELIAVDKPMILKQPESQYRTNGETATFTVEAIGPPGKTLRYFWWKDGQDLDSLDPGRTNFLTINSVTAADAGKYQVQIEDDCGVTLSDVGLLTLKPGLQIFSSQTTATLLWSNPNVALEQADTPNGPWSTVPGATSPFTPSLLGATKFFRLKLL